MRVMLLYMKLVSITWVDAAGGDGWVSKESLTREKPIVHHSVGYVVSHDERQIIISMSYDESGENMGAWLLIPRKYIREIKALPMT